MEFGLEVVSESDSSAVNVVFLHGLKGDSKDSWRNSKGQFWPEWLAKDFPDANIYSLQYPANLFKDLSKDDMSLYERSKSCLDLFESKKLSERPTALIAHSLGGLLVKQLLQTATSLDSDEWKAFAEQVDRIFFLGTPHDGAGLASVFTSIFGTSSEFVKELSTGNSKVLELSDSFRKFCADQEVEVAAYYEKHKFKGVLVVSQTSANPGVNGCTPVPMDADHVSLAKPQSEYDGVYGSIRTKLERWINSKMPTSSSNVGSDRRDLLQKLQDAGREHEYHRANELQNNFAQHYMKLGLHTPERQRAETLLDDVEQRFFTHVYSAQICAGAEPDKIDDALQEKVIDPIVERHTHLTPMRVLETVYYLGESCQIRWDEDT